MMRRRFSLLLRNKNNNTPSLPLSRPFNRCLNGLNFSSLNARNGISLIHTPPLCGFNQINALSPLRSSPALDSRVHNPLRFIQKRSFCSTTKDSAADESDSLNRNAVLFSINDAVFEGDLDKMKEFIKNGVNINAVMEGLSPFEIAIKQGHIHIVKELIQMGVDVNSLPDDSETTPLFVAIENNQLEIFKLLIERKADPYLPNKEGYLTPFDSAILHNNTEMIELLKEHITPEVLTNPKKIPLHIAAAYGNLDLVKFFVERGANIELTDSHGLTPLHNAAITHRLEVAQYLISLGASVDKKDNQGHTPLFYAVSLSTFIRLQKEILKLIPSTDFDPIEENYLPKRYELVKLLLQHGANPNTPNSLGQTPIFQAITEGNLDVIKELVKYGANVHVIENNGRNLLHEAATLEPEIAEYLLGLGLNVNVREGKEGLTPLHIAAADGIVDTLKLFLKHGAQVDAVSKSDATPLVIAVINSQLETVQVLLENGANVDYKNVYSNTPLFFAAYNQNLEMVKLLLRYKATICDTPKHSPLAISIRDENIEILKALVEYGANVHQVIHQGQTPLHYAITNNQINVVKYLISIGVNVNELTTDFPKVSPVYLAVSNLDQEMARLLLQHKANPNLTTLETINNTPLHYAVEAEDIGMAKILLQHKADVNLQNMKGETPLHFATETGDLEMVQLLLQYKPNLNIQTKISMGGENESSYNLVFSIGGDELRKKREEELRKRRNRPLPAEKKLEDVSFKMMLSKNAGFTPLHIALRGDHKEIADLLLKSGADASIRTTERDLPLHFASKKGNIKIVEQLLKIAPNQVDQKGKKGFTALHYAISNNHLELTLLLLKRGAVMNAINDDGKTPFELFPSQEFEKAVINYLRSK